MFALVAWEEIPLRITLKCDPDHALAHAALGVFYGKLGRQDEAVEHSQRVCELESDDPFSFMAMSMICQQAGRIPEAEQALGIAVEKQWANQRKP